MKKMILLLVLAFFNFQCGTDLKDLPKNQYQTLNFPLKLDKKNKELLALSWNQQNLDYLIAQKIHQPSFDDTIELTAVSNQNKLIEDLSFTLSKQGNITELIAEKIKFTNGFTKYLKVNDSKKTINWYTVKCNNQKTNYHWIRGKLIKKPDHWMINQEGAFIKGDDFNLRILPSQLKLSLPMLQKLNVFNFPKPFLCSIDSPKELLAHFSDKNMFFLKNKGFVYEGKTYKVFADKIDQNQENVTIKKLVINDLISGREIRAKKLTCLKKINSLKCQTKQAEINRVPQNLQFDFQLYPTLKVQKIDIF